MTNRRKTREWREYRPVREDSERPPLPAGHPIAWEILNEGTLLAGVRYPLPVFP